MPTDPILYNFFEQYDWLADDFTAFQADMLACIESGREKRGVLTGLQVLPPVSGLLATVKAGVACNTNGRLLVVATDSTILITAPSGNPAWGLLVLRPVDTNATPIPDPLNPVNTVYLNTQRSASLVWIPGTPSGSPSYPSAQAGDLILMGLQLTNGQTNLTSASFDLSQRNTRHQQELLIEKATYASSPYSIPIASKIVEVDASGGNVVLNAPDINQSQCREYTVRKIDSSANTVTLNFSIDGQTVVLSSQYDYITFYSNSVSFGQKG